MLKIKRIKPLFTSILTTGEKYTEDMRENGIIVANKGDLKTYQTVLEVGSSVRDINVGDKVMIDMMHFAVMKYDPNSVKNDMDMNKAVKWNIPWVIIDDEKGNPQDCLLISDRDVKFVFEGDETNESIIIPNKPTIITN
jgi:hypothetical protein